MARSPRLAFALVVLSSWSVPNFAQESAFTEQVVVSANLTPAEASTVGSSVTVIGADELDARNQPTALEVLRSVPGVAIVQNGGPGRTASAFLRGGSSSQTLVLVDGVRVNAPGSGAVDLADLPTAQIERIEILRGPQSSLYGSEAIGGVIQVFTKRGRAGQHGSLAAETGTAGTARLLGGVDGASGRWDWRVGGQSERQPGFSLAAQAAGDEAALPYRNRSAAAAVGARVGEAGRAEASLRYVDATAHPDSFDFAAGPIPAPLYTQQHRQLVGSASFRAPVTAWWTLSVRAGYDRDRLEGANPGNPFGFDDYRIRGENTSAALQSDFTLAAHHVLSAGTSWERRHGADIAPATGASNYDETVTLRALFVQDQWSWNDRLFLTGALRRDEHSTFGGKTTYRATAAYRVRERGTRLHASYGTGFRAPTLVDLFYPWFGNRALRPETSTGWDAGVSQAFANGRVNADLSWFRSDYDDLIQYDPLTATVGNVARARARGLEGSVEWTASKAFALAASYTWTRTEDLATGLALPRRPAHQGALTARFRPAEKLSGLVSWIVMRDRVDAGGAPMDAVERMDANVAWRFTRALSGFARVQNLFDRRYAEVPGYLSPGRIAVVGVSVGY